MSYSCYLLHVLLLKHVEYPSCAFMQISLAKVQSFVVICWPGHPNSIFSLIQGTAENHYRVVQKLCLHLCQSEYEVSSQLVNIYLIIITCRLNWEQCSLYMWVRNFPRLIHAPSWETELAKLSWNINATCNFPCISIVCILNK